MNINDIKRLLKLVETSDIEELEVQEEGFQIRITKRKSSPIQYTAAPIASHSSVPSEQMLPEMPVQEAKVEHHPGRTPDKIVEICSPMVGTFYRAASPDSEPFAEVGDEIKPGKVLCIVEAMKLMNEIEAEVHGKVVKILVENAQAVEYNQPLFLVETP